MKVVMKTKIFLSILAMSLLASCQPAVYEITTESESESESSDIMFKAFTESELATKTALSDNTNSYGYLSLYWKKGDAISLSDGTNSAIFVTDNDGGTSGEFYNAKGSVKSNASLYTAFYPSSISASNMVLPSNQTYVKDNVAGFPMRAISTNQNLGFKNLCGIIRLNLKFKGNGSLKISKIILSANNQGMSGAFVVGDDNAAVVKGTNGVLLSCETPVQLSQSVVTGFNIIVPKGDYNPLKVMITSSDGKELNLISKSAVHVERSGVTNISLSLDSSSFGSSLEVIPITDSNVEFTDR